MVFRHDVFSPAFCFPIFLSQSPVLQSFHLYHYPTLPCSFIFTAAVTSFSLICLTYFHLPSRLSINVMFNEVGNFPLSNFTPLWFGYMTYHIEIIICIQVVTICFCHLRSIPSFCAINILILVCLVSVPLPTVHTPPPMGSRASTPALG